MALIKHINRKQLPNDRHTKAGIQITEKDYKIAKAVGMKDLALASIQLYNRLCKPCKRKAIQNPRRDPEDYCSSCQKVIDEKFGKWIKK